MKKFEYRLLNPQSGFFGGFDYQEINERLSQLGSQGWEVVSVVGMAVGLGQTTSLLITLKREIG